MKFNIEVWNRWHDWIDLVRVDLEDIINAQAVFEGFREIVQANAGWLDSKGAAFFVDFVARGYVARVATGIRRHSKQGKDDKSLRKLVEQIKKSANQITYGFYLDQFPPSANGWQQITFGKLSCDLMTVSAERICEDCSKLDSISANITALVDRTIAHLDGRGSDAIVTDHDLQRAVEEFNLVARKYVEFLTGDFYDTLRATMMLDWKVFRHPWDIRQR